MSERIVILGAGIAGLTACETVLKEAPGADVTLLSDEQDLPYLRPLLSKLGLSTFRRDSLAIHPADWYLSRGVQLLRGTKADRIDTEKKEVLLADGTGLPYDKCIYALGARCHVPPIPGRDLPGVACVRTIKDLQKIRRLLAPAKHAVVIGGGVIGLEFAWEIQKTGCEVTVLEALPHLMARVLDPESAEVLKERCKACGIAVRTGAETEKIEGADRAEAVTLAGGERFPADLVLLSCGIRANTEVALRSGLACGRGVLVDDHLRTSDPNVFAAGDCIQLDESALHAAEGRCSIDDTNPGLWTYAKETGELAGANAVRAPEEALTFRPGPEPVLLSALGTSLFAMGDVQGEDCCSDAPSGQPKALCPGAASGSSFDTQAPLFQVNPRGEEDLHHEKRFYRDGRLYGAVLIGDLSKMTAIKEELSS